MDYDNEDLTDLPEPTDKELADQDEVNDSYFDIDAIIDSLNPSDY